MVNKKEFIWNSVASVVASMLSALLLLFITRMNGSSEAGLFSITFATATILNAVGDFGMRIFQVTDTQRIYKFNDYVCARLAVAVIMLFVGLIVCVVSKYDFDKSLLCMILICYRFVEVLSETYQGEFQLNQKLDIAAKSVVYRTCGAIISFAVVDYLTGNVVLAAISMVIWAAFVSISYDLTKIKKYTSVKIKPQFKNIKALIWVCFPTFFSTFLNLYIINAPKYAIDDVLTYQDQTIFNVIFLPTFTINLMSIFVLKPMLLGMGVMWNENRIKDFKKMIFKMSLLILGLTLGIEAVCYFVGIPILTLIYGIESLSLYRIDLLILIISGGLSALAVMYFYALTTMRSQKLVAIPYVLSAVTAFVICTPMVEAMQIRGAVLSSVLITLILCCSSLFVVVYSIRKKK